MRVRLAAREMKQKSKQGRGMLVVEAFQIERRHVLRKDAGRRRNCLRKVRCHGVGAGFAENGPPCEWAVTRSIRPFSFSSLPELERAGDFALESQSGHELEVLRRAAVDAANLILPLTSGGRLANIPHR